MLVSIIIPTIGRQSLIKTIKSVLNQTYTNIEIIITDDTDDGKAYEIIKEFLTDKRVKYVRNERYKRGPTGNKNNGLDYITGDYFTIVDDDDSLFPDAIETLITIAKRGNYPVVIGNCLDPLSGKFTGLSYGEDMELTYEDFLSGRLDGEYFGIVASYLLDKDKFKEDTWGGGEHLLWWKIFKRVEKGYYINKALRVYSTEGKDKVTIFAERYPKRQVLNYYYTLLEFGDDLKRINQKQYLRYLLRGIYFAKLAENKEKLNFFREQLKRVDRITLKTFAYFYYLFTKILPKGALIKINSLLYKTARSLLKKWMRKQ